jgi:DNA-binding NtrC family response regulator
MRLAGVELLPTEADVEQLRRYRWPGNVRELAAVIERAAILGGGRRLDVAGALAGSSSRRGGHSTGDRAPLASLEVAMRHHIEQALHRAGGKIEGPSGAAAMLSINPHTLRARMRKLKIPWAQFRR